MRYMSLSEMLDGLRIEARISQSAAHGLTLRDPHVYLLNRIQDDLWLNFDWAHLRTSAFVDINAGQRYVAYPDGMAFESVRTIYSEDTSGDFRPMVSGIDAEHYNLRDPEVVSERETPIRRWANYVPPEDATNFNMIELWPVPDKATRLYVKGRRMAKKLVNDGDMSTLDGMAIVLHAAAEILAGQKAEDAALKLNKAQERVRTLKVRHADGDNRAVLLSGRPNIQPARRGIDYIP